MADSLKGIDQISSLVKSHTLSRRSFVGLAAGAALLAVDNLALGSFPDGEGSISQRRGVFTKIVSEIAKAKVTGDKEAIETSEKVLYLWTFCNTLELGARSQKLSLAADHMRHFLYGGGSPVDLSNRFGVYLKENYGVTNNRWDKELGAIGLISHALYLEDGKFGQVDLDYPDYLDQLRGFVSEHSSRSQKSPIVFSAGLGHSDFNHQANWMYGIGESTYKLQYKIAKDWYKFTPPTKGKVGKLSFMVTDYNLSFTDIYDWDSEEHIVSAASYFSQFINSLGVGSNKERWDSLRHLIHKIEEKYYPEGIPEKEFDLLVKNGYAHNFDMSGHASDSNLTLELSFGVGAIPK